MSATSIAEKFEVIADAAYDKGTKEFAKAYQEEGNRTDYSHAFRRWTKEYFDKLNPMYDITAQNAQYMFQGANIPVDLDTYLLEQFGIKLTTEGATGTNLNYMFNDSTITGVGIIDASNCTQINYIFLGCGSLKYVKKLKVSEKCTSYNMFVDKCYELKSIDIEGTIAATVSFSHCPLDKNSLYSATNALSDSTSGLSSTWKKTAVESAFGVTIADETTYTDEFNTWRNSKPNWIFKYA